MAERIPVPKLLSRSVSMWVSGVLALLAIPAVVVWAFLTQPVGNRVAAAVLGVAFVVFVAGLVVRRTWLDPARGELVRQSFGIWRQSVAWAEAEEVRVRANRGGQALLQVRGASARTSFYLPLVAVDLGGDRSQTPEVLRAVADEIERWAPGRGAVVRTLRAQADHLAEGGTVRESPVARAHLSVRS